MGPENICYPLPPERTWDQKPWVPPTKNLGPETMGYLPVNQQTPVKTLPSRRTTYVGGNKSLIKDGHLQHYLIFNSGHFEYSLDHLMIQGFFAFPETCQSSLGLKGARSRSLNKIMIFGIIFIFLLCGCLYNYDGFVVDGLTDNKSSTFLDHSTCKSKRHVVYIKTHKTGSSTITNIMYR